MSEDYVLERDSFETSRQNLEHYYIREVFGFLLHPSIPTGNPSLRVADIGSGSGVWLSDLSRQLPPNVVLDGFDVSFENASPKEFLPKNLTLRYWDIFSDVPDEFVGVYDIVHVSMLAFVLRGDHVTNVMEKLMTLLKPGGWIQWSENDLLCCEFRKTSPELKTEALEALYALSIVHPVDTRFKPTWISGLAETLGEVGFTSIEKVAKHTPPELLMPLHLCGLLVQERLVLKLQGFEWAEKIRDLLPEVYRETQDGAAWDLKRILVVGKKPAE